MVWLKRNAFWLIPALLILTLLLFLLLSGYYLLMPGSIAEPRYQLPALPFICLAAAFGLVYFHGIIKEKKAPSGL